MAVVQNNGNGPTTEDNSGGSLSVGEEAELVENHKDAVVDEESSDGVRIEQTNSLYHNEDKEVETSKEQTKSEPDSTEQTTKKQVSFAVAIDKESSEGSNHDIFKSENVEEKAVAASPDGRFLKFDVEIGRGSFKTVYKGLDTETGVAVAWCELQPNFPQDKKGRAEQYRFKEEAKMLKTLQHPNILRFYDSWEVAGKGSVRPDGRPDRKILVLITELMTSGTLKGYLRRFKDVKPKIIRSWGRQILKGLNYLHTRTPSIIHRDLKCDNIFINGTTGMVKIGDLGLATLKRSHVKTVIGTPEFMAPEMYDEHYDESVDVYAFGMCLLEMTTLQYPYMECTNPGQIYKRVTQGKKPNAIEKVKDPTIRKIIEGCIEEAKINRYTVKDLLALPFFSEAEAIDIKAIPGSKEHEVQLLFQVPLKGPKGQNQSQQQQTHVTYERLFNLHSDQAQYIAQDMVKLNVIREAEVETITKSIEDKVNEAKRTMIHPSDITSSMALPHNSLPSDQDVTSIGSEIFKKPDYAISTPVEELSDTALSSTVDVIVEVDTTNSATKLPGNTTTEKPQQPPTSLDTTGSNTKLTENGDKKNLPSPDTTAPVPLLPASTTSQSNSPSHRLKEQSLHSRDSSSDLSQAGDSQVSMTKELTSDPSITGGNGEIKRQKSRDIDKEVDEQPELPAVTKDTSQQENIKSSSDVTVKAPVPAQQQPPQQQPSSQQQQKKNRQKTTKEKRPLKLTIVGRDKDLVECNLTNGGQTITFKFSLDGDSSEQIAQGMVSANYLSENQKDEFKEYTEKMIEMARNNEMGVVGGSAVSLHQADAKTAPVTQKEGDNKSVESSKLPPLEKLDSTHKLQEKSEGAHKQLEKSESGNKLLEGSESTHKPEKSENGHKLEKSENGHKPGKSENGHKPEKSENGHKPVKSENGHKPEKSENGHKLGKSENGHKPAKSENGHRQLEKSESEPKLTPAGVDSVVKPLNPGPTKVAVGLQTSMDQESQSDQTDSPPPPLTPPAATASGELPLIDPVGSTHQVKSTFDLEQCPIQDVCATTEHQPFMASVATTSQDVKMISDHIISTSTTSSSFAVPATTGVVTVMSMSTPPTTSSSTTTVLTSVSLPSAIGKKFVVEVVSEESDDEMMEEPVENFNTVGDIPCGQDQRADTTTPADVTTAPINIDDTVRTTNLTGACSLRSDSSNSLYDDKTQRVPKVEGGRPVHQHGTASPVFQGYPGMERPSEKPTVEELSKLSESFSVLMYTILQVLRNPAMESFINDLDNRYGGMSGPLSQEYSHDPEYHNMQMRFADEERTLREDHRRRMDEYIQRKRRSVTASPVPNHKSSTSSSNIKARLKQPHNNFVNIPTTGQVPYSSQSHVQQLHYQQHHSGLTPEGENMERKVKQALMTELTPKPKPNGKSDPSVKPSHHKVDNSRLHAKSTVTLHLPQQGAQHQGYWVPPPSTSTWPGEDFHSGSNPNMEMTPEPPNVPTNSRPDISEFDPIETKNK